MDAIINLLATIIAIAILLAPAAMIYILIKAIKKKKKAPNKEKPTQEQTADTPWHSEWKWDEESKLWVHPKSAKPKKDTDFKKSEYQSTTYQSTSRKDDDIKIDFRNAYQAQQIFTKNEWQNYKKLRDVAEVKGYIICPKVRLLDIIKPKSGEKKYKTLLYKVQSKHVDFVICDQNMNIKAIIELDDSSHDKPDRIERDKFVDMILRSVGYKVIHTRYIDYDILDLV